MDIEISEQYYLSRSIRAHDGAARTVDMQGSKIVTGGIDQKVAYFERNDKGDVQLVTEYKFFNDYIFAVLICDENRFAVGCKDSKIYICNFDCQEKPILVLEGHTSVVNSLSLKNEILVSGSWDTCAKIWNLTSGECIATLEGHAYAVSVLISSSEMIYTGSQDGNLHMWNKSGEKLATHEKAHSNIIREIQEAPGVGIYTCSNDAAIKLWSTNLELIHCYDQIHTNFVFSLKVLGDSVFVSGGEDRKVSVINGGIVSQEILHPGTIWCIASDDSNPRDITSACSDGFIRTFSRVIQKKASLDIIDAFQIEGEIAAVECDEVDQKILKSLPTIDMIQSIKGIKEGARKVFREGDIPRIYAWEEGQWVQKGDPLGQQSQKKFYKGDTFFEKGDYDYIFDIEDESGTPRKLPFNDGDNISIIAEEFLKKEQLDTRFKGQIEDFIRQNTRPQI